MANKVTDRLSFAAVYIRLLFNETFLANASAFLWRHEGKAYLVSNWHNFTGRDPKDKQPLSKETGGIPNRVECYFYKNKVSNGNKIEGLIWGAFSFSLLDKEAKPCFLEHPFGSLIDIAVLPVNLDESIVPFFLNEQKFDDRILIHPGQDVFIIGFPLGIITNTPLPIWKRGTIASEPYVLIEGLQKLFVDTASRKGMSGSFVIVQHTGIFTPTPGKMTDDSWIGSGRKILGIYSGRISPSDIEAQLGIVWHRELIEEIILKGKITEI
jgi:hypothetical protein